MSLVLRDDKGTLVGWLTGTVVGEVADLEFLLVAPERRRAGLGSALLQDWIERVRETGALETFLEVRASNEAAIRLYRAAGFSAKGLRKRYYSRPVEDAVVMRALLQRDPVST